MFQGCCCSKSKLVANGLHAQLVSDSLLAQNPPCICKEILGAAQSRRLQLHTDTGNQQR